MISFPMCPSNYENECKIVHGDLRLSCSGGLSESMDEWGCAILALQVVPKNLIFA